MTKIFITTLMIISFIFGYYFVDIVSANTGYQNSCANNFCANFSINNNHDEIDTSITSVVNIQGSVLKMNNGSIQTCITLATSTINIGRSYDINTMDLGNSPCNVSGVYALRFTGASTNATYQFYYDYPNNKIYGIEESTTTPITPTSTDVAGYDGPNFQEWLFVAGVVVFFLSLVGWGVLSRQYK